MPSDEDYQQPGSRKSVGGIKEGELEDKLRALADELVRRTKEEEKQRAQEAVRDLDAILREPITDYVVVPKGQYSIEKDILVEQGGTLEILPGAELYFGRDAGILSYGLVKAVGTEQDRITFATRLDAWKNITLYGSGASGSQLAYCNISQGTGRSAKILNEEWDWDAGGALLAYQASDLRIEHCNIQENKAGCGGGLFLRDCSDAQLSENRVTGNQAERDGGGLYMNECSGAQLSENKVTGNQAKLRGGGLYLLKCLDAQLSENEVTDNKAKWNGGGLYMNDCENARLESNGVTGNKAEWGGGLHLYECSDARLSENEVTGNQARSDGGGLYMRECSDAQLSENEVTGNQARSDGGGLYLSECLDAQLSENEVTGNQAKLRGGGLYLSECSGAQLSGNGVTDNKAKWRGGGLFWYTHEPSMAGNTFKDNRPDNIHH